MGVMVLNKKIRPRFDEYEDLEISFGKSKQTIWQVLNEFARDRSTNAVVGIVALVVCGIASAIVSNSWAAVIITAMVLAFATFMVLHGKKENSENESGDESPGS